jgi:hypothetical protein
MLRLSRSDCCGCLIAVYNILPASRTHTTQSVTNERICSLPPSAEGMGGGANLAIRYTEEKIRVNSATDCVCRPELNHAADDASSILIDPHKTSSNFPERRQIPLTCSVAPNVGPDQVSRRCTCSFSARSRASLPVFLYNSRYRPLRAVVKECWQEIDIYRRQINIRGHLYMRPAILHCVRQLLVSMVVFNDRRLRPRCRQQAADKYSVASRMRARLHDTAAKCD